MSNTGSDVVDTAVLPRRFLRSMLLLTLQRDNRSYGYQLAESVSRLGLQVDMAGVYRDLRVMERHDLVTSEWEPSESGPHRRVYELTSEGVAAAALAESDVATTARLLQSALVQLASAEQPVR